MNTKLKILLTTLFALTAFPFSSTNTLAVGLCGSCRDDPASCDPGLECNQELCIPTSDRQQGSGCMNREQCDRDQNLSCEGALAAIFWCNTNPSPGDPLPGTCQPDDEPPDVIFNCADRGGQCSRLSFTETNCTNNILKSECDATPLTCFVHPTDPENTGEFPGLRGSCIQGIEPGQCGDYGQSCCREDDGAYYCDEGEITIGGGELQTCSCTGGERDLGADCEEDAQCLTRNCAGGTCSLTNQCIRIDNLGTDVDCRAVGGFQCSREGDRSGFGEAEFCCNSSAQCEALGGVGESFPLCFRNSLAGINAAIGCIAFENIPQLQDFWLTWSLGAVGGAAIILIIIAGFQVLTSQGDPKRLQSAKEIVVAVVTGILLLITTALLLTLIGVDILNILPL